MLPAKAGFCPFNVLLNVVENETVQQITTLADGTTVQNVMGTEVVRFTNPGVKTITLDESGPYTITTHPDGTGTATYTGNNFFRLGPLSRANTGFTGLVFTTGDTSTTGGPVTITFHTTASGSRVIDTFTWLAPPLDTTPTPPINGCALLS